MLYNGGAFEGDVGGEVQNLFPCCHLSLGSANTLESKGVRTLCSFCQEKKSRHYVHNRVNEYSAPPTQIHG